MDPKLSDSTPASRHAGFMRPIGSISPKLHSQSIQLYMLSPFSSCYVFFAKRRTSNRIHTPKLLISRLTGHVRSSTHMYGNGVYQALRKDVLNTGRLAGAFL